MRSPSQLVCWLVLLLLLCGCRAPSQTPATQPSTDEFSQPQRVTIRGYDEDAMEPFLTRDGRHLFFNNLNEPTVNTNLYWAERVDDLTFQFKGEISGVNTPALEGVPSMDRDGNFYFVSNRSYDQTASTLYRGRYANGSLSDIALVPGVSLSRPGIVNFDAEISADGNTLYFVESHFDRHGHPLNAKILLATRSGSTFVRSPYSKRILQAINTGGLNYAPATSASGLELYFTRATSAGPAIYVASRTSVNEPFASPLKIESITGFAEGPTLSPDNKALYFHKKENGRFVIYRVTRTATESTIKK